MVTVRREGARIKGRVMGQQIPLDPALRADDPKRDDSRDDGTHEVAPDLAYQRLASSTSSSMASPVPATAVGCWWMPG
jgi:hypothetical protein